MTGNVKRYGITKTLVAVCSALFLIFAAVSYIGYRLAARDSTSGIDFAFKWFGSSFGLIIAIFGMPGILGQWIMKGGGEGNFAYRLTFAILCSIAITWFALKELNAFSLFL